jgi:predicted CXXCH cytochrome family protein
VDKIGRKANRDLSLKLSVGVLLLLSGTAAYAETGYVGSDVCAGCHKDIARTQAQTNMARTWQGVDTQILPPKYSETHAEGPDPLIQYLSNRSAGKPTYSVQMPGGPALEYPVTTTIGGKRHGVTFLFRVPDFEGSPLPRVPLVEGRYIHSVLENGLALELGFSEEKPADYESAFGRVLTPSLEKRCLSCHVAPRTLGTRVETGVACENCHGPGQAHLLALGAHSKDLGILNPAKLPAPEMMKPCSQCHAGSGFVEDPMPSQLLISDQVTGLKNSECWRQSGGQITCTNCHNPHEDAPRAVLTTRSEKTCLGCHSAGVTTHAALCPVNRVTGCVGCHLPLSIHGAFHLADHWIRVHPEQKTAVPALDPAWRSLVIPKHMYLRILVTDDAQKAATFRQQVVDGFSFFDVARANSLERSTGMNGGFMGDIEAAKFDPAWSEAALKLLPGEMTGVIQANGKYVVLQRMTRNFREEAENKVNEAVSLRKEGKSKEAVDDLFAALKIYPYFLRALTYLGINYAQTGNPQVGAGVLSIATRLWPRDQGAHFNLGVAYGALGNEEEIAEYKRTLEIDDDYIPAYLNWGGSMYSKGHYEEAIQMYKKGIDINPLNAALHYSMSLALDKLNRKQEADAELALAAKIDTKYAAR